MNILSNLYSVLKVGWLRNLKSVVVWNKNIVKKILYIIWLLGFIRGFMILKKNKLVVLFKKNVNLSSFRLLQTISKPGRRVFWKKRYIKYLSVYTDRYFIITTSHGVLTQEGCRLLNTGGEPLFLLY